MGLVVRDVVDRLRVELGTFYGHQWREFLDASGLRWFERDLPETVGAVIVEDTVILNRNRPAETVAECAFHEAGHYWLHAGNMETFWRCCPQGDITVARWERQADEFALLFPVWGE